MICISWNDDEYHEDLDFQQLFELLTKINPYINIEKRR